MGVEDPRQHLEQLQREARAMRAQEAALRANMRREEIKLKKEEKKSDEKDTMAWRQEQKAGMLALKAERQRLDRTEDTAASRDFQEHKRTVKVSHKEQEIHNITEEYVKTKENADWHVELQRQLNAERPKIIIEENLEKLRTLAEYNLEEQQREENETMISRGAKEQAEIDHKMAQAKRERDLALQSLEYMRAQQQVPVPSGRHLLAHHK